MRDERVQAWRGFGFLLACLCAPVYLPGRDYLPALQFQLYMAPFSLGLGLGLWLCLGPLPERLLKVGLPNSNFRLAALSALLLAGSLAMHRVQLGRYMVYGYRSLAGPLLALDLLGAAGLIFLGRSKVGPQRAWLGLILALGAGGMLLSIAYYPLARERSDMLFLLEQGAQSWLRGDSLTQAYQPAPAVQVTYFPGLWLSYLPAVAGKLDLRLWSLASTLAASALLWLATPAKRRGLALVLLAAFWLSPWFQYRHEAYVHGLFLPAAVMAWALLAQRPWLAALSLGWLTTQSQLSWFVAPFVLWHLRLEHGWGLALGAGTLVSALYAAVVGPYLYSDAADLKANIFGYFEGSVVDQGPNLSYWLRLALGSKGLRLAQALALLALFLALAKGLKSPAKALQGAALALLLFIVLNNVIRDYFYFLPLLLLAFALVSVPAPAGKRG